MTVRSFYADSYTLDFLAMVVEASHDAVARQANSIAETRRALAVYRERDRDEESAQSAAHRADDALPRSPVDRMIPGGIVVRHTDTTNVKCVGHRQCYARDLLRHHLVALVGEDRPRNMPPR